LCPEANAVAWGDGIVTLDKIDVGKLTEAVPLLAEVDEDGLSEVLEGGKLFKVPRGSHVYRVGDTCAGFYSLVSGIVHLHQIEAGGRMVLLRKIRAGQSFGATDFLCGAPHRMDAIMVADGLVFRFDAASIREKLSERSPNVMTVIRTLSRSLESNLQNVEERVAHIFSNPDASLAEFKDLAGLVSTVEELDES
jgi:CRP-like cAMP-binding protein